MSKKKKYSLISILHFAKMIYRSMLLLAAVWLYFFAPDWDLANPFYGPDYQRVIFAVIWLVFFVEMLLRFFPSRLESMGCQKQFAKNFRPVTPMPEPTFHPRANVAAAWFVLNGIIGALYFTKVIDSGVLILISLFYAVSDMVCILFFCPFQTFFMKNKCCTTCQIYNWDYAMMFTPLLFVPGLYTWSLLGMALMLLLAWELRFRRAPEQFCEACNESLACVNCQEKLCRHKKQLRHFLSEHRSMFFGP